MIYILTIIIAIIIVWTIISAGLCMDDWDMSSISISEDGVLLTLSKIYWWMIGIIVAGGIVLIISYLISGAIICSQNNGDNKVCINLKSEAK